METPAVMVNFMLFDGEIKLVLYAVILYLVAISGGTGTLSVTVNPTGYGFDSHSMTCNI